MRATLIIGIPAILSVAFWLVDGTLIRILSAALTVGVAVELLAILVCCVERDPE